MDVGAEEIRRYRDLLYTRWRAGAFIAFVDVAEGAATFAGGAVQERRGEGEVPFFPRKELVKDNKVPGRHR
jgi:hypothetical protein